LTEPKSSPTLSKNRGKFKLFQKIEIFFLCLCNNTTLYWFRKDIVTKNLTCGILILLLALTILLVAVKENNDSAQAEGGLEIVEAEEASGPVDGANNTSIEVYTYDFALFMGEMKRFT
jgi:hypothetical protein